MRGHNKIIEARIAGQKPPFIFINDYPCKTDWSEHGEHATVCTHGDAIASLDLRFLVGTKVSITAHSEARAKGLFECAKVAGAVLVGAGHATDTRDGWCEIWHKESTNG